MCLCDPNQHSQQVQVLILPGMWPWGKKKSLSSLSSRQKELRHWRVSETPNCRGIWVECNPIFIWYILYIIYIYTFIYIIYNCIIIYYVTVYIYIYSESFSAACSFQKLLHSKSPSVTAVCAMLDPILLSISSSVETTRIRHWIVTPCNLSITPCNLNPSDPINLQGITSPWSNFCPLTISRHLSPPDQLRWVTCLHLLARCGN